MAVLWFCWPLPPTRCSRIVMPEGPAVLAVPAAKPTADMDEGGGREAAALAAPGEKRP